MTDNDGTAELFRNTRIQISIRYCSLKHGM